MDTPCDTRSSKAQLVTRQARYASAVLILFLRETDRDSVRAGEGQRLGEAHNLKQAPGSELFQEEPNAGLEPLDHEIMSWAKVGCLTD